MRKKLNYFLWFLLVALLTAASFTFCPRLTKYLPDISNIATPETPIESVATVTSSSVFYKMLDATVRVKTKISTGSGVILFSELAEDGSYYSYIITNRHVVASFKDATIERVSYFNHRKVETTHSYPGRIVAKTSTYDLAVVEIKTAEALPNATLLTRDDYENTKLFDEIFISGCPQANNPLITKGNIANIDSNTMLVTAFAIFGSSGGAVYTKDGQVIGIAQRIALYQQHNTNHAVPQLTYVIPVNVVASWLKSRRLSFIYTKDLEALDELIRKRRAKAHF